ncbi:hypothetical protein [Kutzneria kofuensis]|uniref:Uncharacterized protein n=1 Tax=Kutzneria kofuensis TaxID=103725 RepID=A0A7W9NLK1_9PSEU|nr:hypothetical protein [Kutzneria kofuensis]MBB5897095.1 hypothetical protein [Kutzneria kofuensis]
MAGRHRLSDCVSEEPGLRFALAVAASIVVPLIAAICTVAADTGAPPAAGSGCSGPARPSSTSPSPRVSPPSLSPASSRR